MMALLPTKLMAPVVPPSIMRSRLLKRFNENPGVRLVLLQAGAGYGKTSLVSSYLQHGSLPSLWYQLDEFDADPATFAMYLAEGIKGLVKEINLEVLEKHPCPDFTAAGYKAGLEELLSWAIKVLEGSNQRVALVFDDYHLVKESEEIRQFMERMINYLPQGVQVVITSRIKLPLSLARSRARGWIVEMGDKDLRFTLEEAATMMADLNLSEDLLRQIWEKTEGWAAGLFLARYTLSSSPTDEKESIDRQFTSYTMNYLEEEILHRFSPRDFYFLETTSVLEYMDLQLCSALTGEQDAAGILEKLTRENLFVYVLEDGCTYRYHQLLRDYLLERVRERYGEDYLKGLYLQAARIFLEQEDRYRAMLYYFRAGELEHAINLLLELAPELLQQGEFVRLRHYLESIPAPKMEELPEIFYYKGRVLSVTGFSDTAREQLQRGEDLLVQQEKWLEAARCAAAQGSIANEKGRPKEGVFLASRAMDYLEKCPDWEGKLEVYCEATTLLSQGYLLQEDWSEAARWAGKSVQFFAAAGYPPGQARLKTREYQFFIYHPRQDLRQALRAFEASQQMWKRFGNRHEALMAQVNVATIYRIMGEYEKAFKNASSVLYETQTLNFDRGRAFALFVLAQVQRDQGEMEAALEIFHDVIFLARQQGLIQLEAGTHHSLSGLYRKKGNLDASHRHAKNALELAQKTRVNYFNGQALMNLGAVYRAQFNLKESINSFEQAREIFKQWQADYEQARVGFYLAEALLKKRSNDPPDEEELDAVITDLIKESVKLIRLNDYRFFFTKEKEFLLPVLRWAVARGLEHDYLSEILVEIGEEQAALPFQVYTLGPLQAYREGKAIPSEAWKSAKVSGLFRFLLARRGQKVERDIILETFWPEKSPRAAAHNFSSCLYSLRKALEPELEKTSLSRLLRFEKGLCWLDTSGVLWTDVDQFVEGIKQARRYRQLGKKEYAAQSFKDALELYRGDFLVEYPYDDWLVAERERLREMWLQGSMELAGLFAEREEFDQAVRLLQGVLRKEPYQEEIYRQQIRYLLQAGRRAEALEQYRICEQMLSREFGAQPGEETRKLFQQ